MCAAVDNFHCPLFFVSSCQGVMTVKIHYTTTRALRVSSSITFVQLLRLICRKFDRPDDSLTIWYVNWSDTSDQHE